MTHSVKKRKYVSSEDTHVRVRSLLAIIGFLLMACLPIIPAAWADYEEPIRESIFLVRPDNEYIPDRVVPTYLSTEDMAFFACIEYEDTPVRLSLLCEDNNNFIDVPATKWGTDSCYIGSVDLDEFPCNKAIITADYVHDGENERLTKEIKINTVTSALQKVLSTQYADGGWSSPLDTSYALFGLKPFRDVFNDTVQGGLTYLKNSRDEQDKCWPKNQCQASATSAITYLLYQAGYEDDLRIIHDSSIYLEKTMSYIDSGETWDVQLEDFLANYNNTVNTSCVFAYGEDNTTYNLSKNGDAFNVTITPEYDITLNVICTENIIADLYSSVRGQMLHYEGDNFTYTIPGPCWTLNNENVTCDLRSTAFAIGTPIDEDRRDAAQAYLESQLESSITGIQFSDGDMLNLAVLLNAGQDDITSEDQDQIIRHILYAQTNEGSWNTSTTYYNHSYYEPQAVEIANLSHVLNDTVSNNVIYTGFVLQALLNLSYDHDDEVIDDAARWMSLHEDSVSTLLDDESATDEEIVADYQANVSDILNNTKRNGMALFILQQNTRPLLKTSERIIILDKANLTIDLVNPTTFTFSGLSYELAASLSPYVSIEEKEYLAPFSFRKLVVSQKSTENIDAFGYLRINEGANEYAKIPVVVLSYPSLKVDIPSQITAFGTSVVVPLTVDKTGHNFSCTLKWKDAGISSLSSFTIEVNKTFNLPLQFSQPATEEKSYSGILTCTARTSTFTFPFTMLVSRFITKPLAIAPTELIANYSEQTLSFSLKNLLDESIDITIGLANGTEASDYVDFSDYVLNLYPGETKNVSVFITVPAGMNVSDSTAVLIKVFNLEERIPVILDIVDRPEDQRPLWLVVGGSVFAIGLVVLLSYFGYTNRKKIYEWYTKNFNKETEYKRVMKSVQEYELRGEAIAVKNMVQILKMEGTSDKDIRKRLVEMGFTEDEITVALKMKTEDEKSPASQNTAPRK